MYLRYLKDFFVVLAFLFLAFIVVYYVPPPINRFIFLLVLPLAWYSKKDYVWLAFFFVLEDQPGGLFSGGERDSIYRIPIYSLISGISFSIRELYLIMLLGKVLLKKHYTKNFIEPFFKKYLNWLAILFVLLVIITLLVGGTFDSYRYIAKITVNLTLFYSIFYIIPNRITFEKFVITLFPFAFVAIILQLYGLSFNQQLVGLFQSDTQSSQGVFDVQGRGDILERPIELVHILLINFTASLFLINYNTSNISKNYLWLVNVLAFVSIFMTATRIWFLALIVGYLLFALISRSSVKILFRYLFLIVFVVIIGILIPAISKQISMAWERIDTIQLIIQGDITAGGTIKRYDQRAPAVVEAFEQSTVVFGAAFGKLHQENQDFHVGYHNLLLNIGIFGALMFLFFTFNLLFISFSKSSPKKVLPVAAIAFIMILILNTGSQFIGFNVQLTPRFFIQAYVLLLLAIAYRTEITPNSKRGRH